MKNLIGSTNKVVNDIIKFQQIRVIPSNTSQKSALEALNFTASEPHFEEEDVLGNSKISIFI